MSRFSETSLPVCRKIFSAFYLILHEDFSNRYGFPLTEQFNLFSPHLVLYMITMESRIIGGVAIVRRGGGEVDIVIIINNRGLGRVENIVDSFLVLILNTTLFSFSFNKQAHIPYTIQYKKTGK